LRLKDNLASLEVKLSPEQLGPLDKVSKIEMGFPHDLFNKEMVQAFASGRMKDMIDRS
jgi:hypothetical protein